MQCCRSWAIAHGIAETLDRVGVAAILGQHGQAKTIRRGPSTPALISSQMQIAAFYLWLRSPLSG